MRLFKLASEINVGKDTIVDFLRAKGFDVESKASTKLTEDQVDIVLGNFVKEHAAAEKLRQSIPPVRKKTQAVHTSGHDAQHDDAASTAVEHNPPIQQVVQQPVQHEEQVRQPAVVAQNDDKPAISAPQQQTPATSETGVAVGTVIDLKDLSSRRRPLETSKPKPVTPQATTPATPAAQPAPKPAPVADKVPESVTPVAVSAPVAASKENPVQKPAAQQIPTPTPVSAPPKPAAGPQQQQDGRNQQRPQQQQDGRHQQRPQQQQDGRNQQPRRDDRNDRRDDRGDRRDDRGDRPQRQFDDRRPAGQQQSAPNSGQQRPQQQRDGNSPHQQPRRDDRNDRRDDRGDRRDDRGDRPQRQFDDRRPAGQQTSASGQQQRDGNSPHQQPRRDDRQQPPRPPQPFHDAAGQQAPLSEEERSRRKKKKRKISEIEYQVGESPALPGLTILGKIDLNAVSVGGNTNDKRKDKDKDKRRGPGDATRPPLSAADKKKKDAKKKPVAKVVTTGDDPIKEPAKKNRKRGKKDKRDKVSSEAVDQAIRRTLLEMDDSSSSSRSKIRQRRRLERAEESLRQQEFEEEQSKILRVTEFISVSELATLLNVPANEIILKCMSLGLMVSINQRLEADTITLIADDYGRPVEFEKEFSPEAVEEEEDPEELLQPRPPIVTVMGHVDHGKTSLLDYIRRANVVAGESGGITQHIGAYSVRLPNNTDKVITFLDTPGHQAFTAMRARGAQVTDIVILVVAADDNVMPQTLEAISHAQAANVPIIVAINKIDKPDANPDKVKQQLADRGVLVEEWGGKYQSIEISAKTGLNIDTLLEKVLLEAELLELKANPDRRARGIVIESQIDKGKGAISTIIVQKGQLRVGDPFIAGIYAGRVRAMFDERGHKVEMVGPSTPVQIIGFDGVPTAGDHFVCTASESEAKEIATKRQQIKREQDFKQVRHVTLDDIASQIKSGGVQDLRIVLKADTDGSLEALTDSLEKLSTSEVRVSVIHRAVGAISESDIMLAAASDAIVIGFHVRPTPQSKRLAEAEQVDIRIYRIIYDCINEIKSALEGMLAPETKEEVSGIAEVRDIFRISKVGTIAGCYMIEGKITRNDTVRLVRDGFEIFTGRISSLRRHKDDVREVEHNYECGISLDGYNDIKVGDFIEAVKIIEIKRTLK